MSTVTEIEATIALLPSRVAEAGRTWRWHGGSLTANAAVAVPRSHQPKALATLDDP